jgi:acyl carrier protein
MNANLVQIISDTFGLDPGAVTQETAAENTPEWDSVMHLNLCLSVEEAFQVKLTPEEMMEMTSVRAIEDVLARHGVK